MKRTSILLLTALVLSAAMPVAAQGPVASVSGDVRDASGGSIAAVAITARGVDTNVSRSTVTTSAGNYTLVGLSPGRYEISAEAPGFKKEVRTDITLQVAQDARMDFVLQIGEVSDVVNVTEQAPVTETESASTGTVIDNTKVVELPLNGRQFYNLALLVPGANLSADNSTTGFRGGFNVSGRAETNNNFTVNGFDNNDQSVNAPTVRPSVDDIQEFKLLTGIYPAEYGRSAGGQVIVVTKSGSNAVHGSLYEFVRNQLFDARNYFTQTGVKRAYRRNNFGATIGGPIVKNKTFFHFSYEGLRLVQQVTAVGTVPTQAQIAGNFSSLLSAARPTTVRNPLTGVAFPGNIIPASLISPVGQSLLRQFPAESLPTLSGAPVNNFILNANQTESLNQYGTRIDHTFSGRDSLSSTYQYFLDPVTYVFNSLCGSSVMPNGGCYTGWTGQLFGVSEVHVFSPTLINEVRAGVNRMRQPRIQSDVDINFWGPFNITAGAAVSDNTGVPQTTITGFSRLGGPTNLPQDRWDTTFDYRDTVSWQVGKHALKFGGQFRPFASNFKFVSSGRGSLVFNGAATAPTSGYPLADVLLGYPTSTANNPLAPPIYGRTKAYFLFAQDDFKFSRRLTINYGLRWEYNTPYRDAQNRLSTINLITGKMDVQGTPEGGDPLYKGSWRKFAPRLGFAWQPFGDAKTVVRGGAGIFYDNTITFNGLPFANSNPPFRAPATFTSNLITPVTLSNPFPLTSNTANPTAGGLDKNYTTPNVYEWSLGVQRQLPGDLLLEVVYFGSRGVHLPLQINANQPLPGPGTATQVQARRPYPVYANITFLQSANVSRYNSLQIKVEKKASKNLAILLAETYGRSIDAGAQAGSTSSSSRGAPQNSRFWKGEMGMSDFNVKSRTVLSVISQLPFGKGQKWMTSGVGSLVAGGWQLSGITTYQTGRPWTPYFTTNISNTTQLSDRPNVVLGCDPYAGFKTVAQWVNPACFSTPAIGNFGNLGRNVLVGPGLVNLDFALDRSFKVKERVRIQFRGEVFNSMNHPNFNIPTTAFDSPSFGSLTSTFDARQVQLGLKIVY